MEEVGITPTLILPLAGGGEKWRSNVEIVETHTLCVLITGSGGTFEGSGVCRGDWQKS